MTYRNDWCRLVTWWFQGSYCVIFVTRTSIVRIAPVLTVVASTPVTRRPLGRAGL